ncbi:BatA domain-containing protein [Pseudoduganella sp. UC29_106]|uniref:BatA domain-containing protein n=1 Tax=Pseudoduganella sp. UC29_106 TaxID=3374553 RepID=UPI0037579FE2
MTSMLPMWWFALPVLLLPLWWHLQKRERTRTEPLATARFLPAAAPRQQRVPRLIDLLLLFARLLLLVALIAWLAVLTMPLKRDTVFIDPALASDAWAVQQIRAAGMDAATREPLPADVWNWLARNEHAWHPSARFLIVARKLPMPALPPRLAHTVTLRTPAPHTPAPAAVSAPAERHVVIATSPERLARWKALFAAFSTAGDNAYRYVLTDQPTPETELIVWDRPDAQPPTSWQSPLWWRTTAAGAAPERRGHIWSASQWPLQDAAAARTLYEQWQRQSCPPGAYPMPAIQTMPAQRKTPLPATLAASPEWLAAAMLALFAIERILAHVRRSR